jgi:hypothetical protein
MLPGEEQYMITLRLFIAIAVLLCASSVAQVVPISKPLHKAVVGIEYCESINDVLSSIKLKSTGNDEPDFGWKTSNKLNLPKGLKLESSGDLCGTPEETNSAKEYLINLEIFDRNNRFARAIQVSLILPVLEAVIEIENSPDQGRNNEVTGTIVSSGAVGGSASPATNRVKRRSEILDEELAAYIKVLDDSQQSKEARVNAARTLGLIGHRNFSESISALSKHLGSEIKAEAYAALVSISETKDRKENRQSRLSGNVVDDVGNAVQGATIQLKDRNNGSVIKETSTNNDGSYSFGNVKQSTYTLQASQNGFEPKTVSNLDLGSALPTVENIALRNRRPRPSGEFSRLIIGFEQSGATASQGRQNFFLDGFFSIPFPWKYKKFSDKDFGPKWRIWGNARISSAPDPALGELEVQQFVRDFAQNASDTRVKNVIQTFEVTSGLEYRLTRTDKPYLGTEGNIKGKFSLSLIAGAGIVAPVNPSDPTTTSIFEVNSDAIDRYPQADGKTYIAFVAPERDRFYRQYFGGIRLRTFYFDNGERPYNRYPATLDITYGQNEAITGGFLKGGVMKIEGFFPLPIKELGSLYLFGSAQMKFSRPSFGDPLILQRVQNIDLPNADALLITLPPLNRDHYRIGFGVDPIKLFRDFFRRNPGQTAAQLVN